MAVILEQRCFDGMLWTRNRGAVEPAADRHAGLIRANDLRDLMVGDRRHLKEAERIPGRDQPLHNTRRLQPIVHRKQIQSTAICFLPIFGNEIHNVCNTPPLEFVVMTKQMIRLTKSQSSHINFVI